MATDYIDGPHRPKHGPNQSINPGMNAGMEAQQAAANAQDKVNQDALGLASAAKAFDQGDAQSKTNAQDLVSARAALDQDDGAKVVPDPVEALEARRELNQDYRDAGKQVAGLEVAAAREALDHAGGGVSYAIEDSNGRELT